MRFEWDRAKDATNRTKHGVSFAEAMRVFGDPLAISIDDRDHSAGEARLLTSGRSAGGRLLIVAHTDRDGRLRIINAREVTRREREQYESGN